MWNHFCVLSLVGIIRLCYCSYDFISFFKYAKEIQSEAKHQNQLLDTIQNAADSAGSMLGRTVGRVIGFPSTRHNNRKLLYLTVLVFFSVFVVYYLVRLLPI